MSKMEQMKWKREQKMGGRGAPEGRYMLINGWRNTRLENVDVCMISRV